MSISKREELVSELTSFYEFLVGLHLPADALKRPPPGGWPGINQETLAYLNKDDNVIDLLKHIPYFRQDKTLNPYQIYESCACNDFTGAKFERFGLDTKDPHATEPFQEELGPHIATLAQPAESDGYHILCDTKQHTLELVDYIVPERREHEVKEFFEMLKDEFRQMTVLPVEPRKVYMVRRCDDDVMEMFKDILRRNGWPSESFQKDKCLRELKSSRPENY